MQKGYFFLTAPCYTHISYPFPTYILPSHLRIEFLSCSSSFCLHAPDEFSRHHHDVQESYGPIDLNQPPAMRTRGKPSSGGAVLHARRRHIVSLGRCTAIQECMYRAREHACRRHVVISNQQARSKSQLSKL